MTLNPSTLRVFSEDFLVLVYPVGDLEHGGTAGFDDEPRSNRLFFEFLGGTLRESCGEAAG